MSEPEKERGAASHGDPERGQNTPKVSSVSVLLNVPLPIWSLRSGNCEMDRKILALLPCTLDVVLGEFDRGSRSTVSRQIASLARWDWIQIENRLGTLYLLPGERLAEVQR